MTPASKESRMSGEAQHTVKMTQGEEHNHQGEAQVWRERKYIILVLITDRVSVNRGGFQWRAGLCVSFLERKDSVRRPGRLL